MRPLILAGVLPLLAAMAAARPAAQAVVGPAPAAAVLFAVIGDNGTGGHEQYEVAAQMAASRREFPFELVLMVGDNLYGRQRMKDFRDKFELPYKPILDAGIPFYAALGNHDSPENRFYEPFNMGGERYYTYTRGRVRFVVLDTNILDAQQLAWADAALGNATERWKIAYFHHPLYSNGGRHGSNAELRVRLEPLLVRHGVTAVFSGHDHMYERITPQRGITYFVTGAGGKLRKGLSRSENSAAAFDSDRSFMLVEIAGEEMSYRAVSRTGRVVDSGVVPLRTGTPGRGPAP